MEKLSCKDLSFRYNTNSADTLKNISFSVSGSGILLVVGKTGSGKSTLLRLMKREISPVGELKGSISILGKAQSELSPMQSACAVAYVSQNPDTQTVTHKVSSELSFALENIGTKPSQILSRVGEMATYFGIEDIYSKPIEQLSGGEKQLCCLCAAAVLSPQILILDEPAAQLDPISSGKLFSVLRRLNSELGTAIIIAEHDPSEIFDMCDSILALDDGKAVFFGDRESFVRAAVNDPVLHGYLPAPTRAALKLSKTVFTVKAAKTLLEDTFGVTDAQPSLSAGKPGTDAALKAESVYYRYDRNSEDIISCLDLTVYSGEVFAAVGSNGSGKTTMLKILGGIIRPWQGKVSVSGRNVRSYKNSALYSGCVAVMPQDPYDLFICQTVGEELDKANKDNELFKRLCSELSLDPLLDKHPYDLSGGEVQKCALAKLLLSDPKILLLDEPSKGLDPQAKAVLGRMLRKLASEGRAVCIATHDIEFAAEYADRCGLFFNGCIHSAAPCREFFSYNRFYTTAASRIARSVFPDAVTVSELEKCISGGERR